MPRVLFALGVSAGNAASFDDRVEALIRDTVATHSKHVCAIGSCGIGADAAPVQVAAFERQAALARELGLPLVVEAPDALGEALDVLKACGIPERGVLVRAFDGTENELAAWCDAGAYVSFDVRAADDAVRFAALAKLAGRDRVLVESGAPERSAQVLAGHPGRCDQVVFAADALQGAVGPGAFSDNFKTLFCS